MHKLTEHYIKEVDKCKARITISEQTFPAFFVFVLQQVGIIYRSLFSIFWEKGWEHRMVKYIAHIRALCDITVDMLIEGKFEHPAVTLNKVLQENNILAEELDLDSLTESGSTVSVTIADKSADRLRKVNRLKETTNEKRQTPKETKGF